MKRESELAVMIRVCLSSSSGLSLLLILEEGVKGGVRGTRLEGTSDGYLTCRFAAVVGCERE